MSITWRRNYKLIIIAVLMIIGLLSIGSIRLIAYNFGQGKDINLVSTIDYTNDVDLFDDSVVHEISLEMAEGDYESMIQTYKETGEKEYFHADIAIDGVTVENVGIRLKGNLTLRQSLGTDGGGGNMGGGRNRDENGQNFDGKLPADFPEMENMPMGMRGVMRPGNMNVTTTAAEFPQVRDWQNIGMDQQNNTATTTDDEALRQEMANPFAGWNQEAQESNPPFLVKFDEFVDGQTYQGYAEVALRIGSDKSLLNEQVVYYVHEQVGQTVPETSYAAVELNGQAANLYVACEHIDERYIAKRFSGVDGILYKAGNFTGFEYLGEDPTLYAEKFEQKTNVNDDDLAQLIEFMKFVTESTDEEFEQQLPEWLDIESFVKMMALDNLLSNNDSFVGMGSNYYLLFNKDTEQFTMLSWDMNLAMGGMGGGGNMGGDRDTESAQKRQEVMQQWLEEGGFDQADIEGGRQDFKGNVGGMGGMGGNNSSNLLKERFFANATFSTLYNEEYARLKEIIYDQGLALDKVNQLAEVFTVYNAEHNILEQSEYDSGLQKITSYIQQQTAE